MVCDLKAQQRECTSRQRGDWGDSWPRQHRSGSQPFRTRSETAAAFYINHFCCWSECLSPLLTVAAPNKCLHRYSHGHTACKEVHPLRHATIGIHTVISGVDSTQLREWHIHTRAGIISLFRRQLACRAERVLVSTVWSQQDGHAHTNRHTFAHVPQHFHSPLSNVVHFACRFSFWMCKHGKTSR